MSTEAQTAELTRQLEAWNRGDERAFEAISQKLYQELRVIARSHLRRDPGAVLETTELIHESFLRLAEQRRVAWQNRRHFFGIASRMMRRILVDQARRAHADKRGGSRPEQSLDDPALQPWLPMAPARAKEVLDVHEALEVLARLDQQQAQIVEMRFFGGLDSEEVAAALDISVSTVFRHWRVARAWLHRQLNQAR